MRIFPKTSLVCIDPRYYQLLVQMSLLVWGVFFLDFANPFVYGVIAIIVSLLTQLCFTRFYALPANLLSSLNSTLSILLLLHATRWYWITLACFIAISSKFLLRYQCKHIFNPSNIGIVMVLLLTPSTWVASGQWGQGIWLALLLAGAGLIMLIGFSRMLTSISFLLIFALLILMRALWLGDTWSIPLHQLQNGALLIFTFFMLSDPMTTPQTNNGRIFFGMTVALLSFALQYGFYISNAFLYALALAMPLVPLLNRYAQSQHYQWPRNSLWKIH